MLMGVGVGRRYQARCPVESLCFVQNFRNYSFNAKASPLGAVLALSSPVSCYSASRSSGSWLEFREGFLLDVGR